MIFWRVFSPFISLLLNIFDIYIFFIKYTNYNRDKVSNTFKYGKVDEQNHILISCLFTYIFTFLTSYNKSMQFPVDNE